MTQALATRTIALAEGRQLEELAQMLEKEGARILRCPLLSILDPADDGPALTWLGQLEAGAFGWVILLTGEGLRRLLACAQRHGRRDSVLAALAKTRFAVRGPKPVRALREVDLAPTLVAQAPTTEGLIASLRTQDLHGLTVGVQLYSDSNPPLLQFLAEAGAHAVTVQPYVYAQGSDADRVAELIDQLAAGAVDSIVFTSSPQVDRLFEVARERQLVDRLQEALRRTAVASVGPVLSETLAAHGIHVAIAPEQGFVMKNLVQLLKRRLA